MARRKRNILSQKKEQIIEIIKTIFKKCFPILLVLFIVVILCLSLKNYIMSMNYFKVKSIVIVNKVGEDRDISFLKKIKEINNLDGLNIFKVHIKWLESQLKKKYPQIKNVVVKRVLPDRIEFVVEQRIPIAAIKVSGSMPLIRIQ